MTAVGITPYMMSMLQACPYYSCRQLKEGAEIILCPYNYLMDPIIRENVNQLTVESFLSLKLKLV